MIKGIGIDTIDIERVRSSLNLPGFMNWFSSKEIGNAHGLTEVYYATRIAGKEAVYKALGNKDQISIQDIEILNDDNGCPYVLMKDCYQCDKIHLSITTSTNLASAFCVIE